MPGAATAPPPIRIDSNENPIGPGPDAARALLGALEEAGRYPHNSVPSERDFVQALSRSFGVAAENVTLGAGSSELLRNAVRAFCGPDRPFVTARPSFELPQRFAESLGVPVRAVPVDARLQLDLDGMVEASAGAGLVFFCNPNNPTGRVHPAAAVAAFVKRVRARSPDTYVLLDEAYHDYVTDPAYASGVPLALADERVLVARTLSKAHGMAGLRVGYGLGGAPAINALARYRMVFDVNVPALAAGRASIGDADHLARESARNREVLAFTARALAEIGCKDCESQANFMFVDVGRPAASFREACKERGVLVGRDFPPFEKTHARISLGTMEEMGRAVEVFRSVLGARPGRAARVAVPA
jgi:histidinol-phosphate aminotransferase